MSAGPPTAVSSPPGPRGARRARSFRSALGWTVVGALVPGSGLLAAGRRRAGAAVLAAFLLLLGALAWLATGGRQALARWTVDTGNLVWLIAVIAAVALLWAAVVVVGYRLLVPRRLAPAQRVLGGVVVAVLVLGIAAPAYYATRLAGTTRELIATVFEDGESATVDQESDPFGEKRRVNVLLLGGDAGSNREGTRTDTVIVASIDTETGETVLISLPRNLQNLPFPAASPLDEVYPEPRGFYGPSESDGLLNAIYDNGPRAHPGILGPTDDEGADWLKLGVGEALGLTIDYYVLVNLDGFKELVDALGGITVNTNYWVPIGGDDSRGILPDDYFRPGPNQELNGYEALMWSRGRYGLSDYERMARQRCAIDAIVEAADPITLLRRYEQLARTTQDIVGTDIPSRVLDDFVDLAFLVKDAEIRSLVLDTSVIDPAYPDYEEIRELVDQALEPPAPSPRGDSTPPSPSSSPSSSSAAPSDPAVDPSPEPTEQAVDDVRDACAYDPEQAAEALAEGEPPSRFG